MLNILNEELIRSQSPRVSVIIPVRNCREYIHEAIDSVLTQGFTDFEVIVIDDGSDDYDYNLLKALDQRVYVIRQEGLGVSHARNVGMRAARGEFFAFLDADDAWFPGKLQAQIHYLDSHVQVGVVFGKFKRWESNEDGKFDSAASISVECGNLFTKDEERSGWLYTRLLMGLLVGMNTAVIRRCVYYQIGGFDEAMRIGEDYDYWLRASRIAEMHSLNGVVALYRIHSSSAMHKVSSINHMVQIIECALSRWGRMNPDKTELTESSLRNRISSVHFEHAYLNYWAGDAKVARYSFLKALAGGEKRMRSLIYFVLASIKLISRYLAVSGKK